MSSAKQIFERLPGVWKISRDIIHRIPKEAYKVTGFAAFTKLPEKDVLIYHERVVVQNLENGSTFTGHKKYKYKYDTGASGFSKYFSDDRLFYKLKIEDDLASGSHLCGSDTYEAVYHFYTSERFTLKYDIRGPKKDYTISTEYTKVEKHDIPALGIVITDGEIGEIL